MNLALGWFFKGFNRLFGWMTAGYAHTVRFAIRGAVVALLAFGCLLYATYHGLVTVPTGFIPTQDKGYLIASVQLPDSASLQRTQEVMARADAIARGTKGVKHTVAVAGQSFLLGANGSNLGSLFIVLDEFENRPGRELYSEVIAMKLRRAYFLEIQDAMVGVFGAPPVDGLGTAGGFKIMLEDRGGNGLAALQAQTDELVARANQQPGLAGVVSMFRANTPQLYVDVDRTKCKTLGVSLSQVFNALQANLGGLYVNDFNQFDRTWQVNVQADSAFRGRPEDVGRIQVRNANGDMVPLGTVASVREISGPAMINRYNMFPAASINGTPQQGISSGQAIETMEQLADEELTPSMKAEWTELTYLERLAGNTAVYIFPLCVLFVFLTHSAEYESWLLPLAIILIAPLSISFALLGVSYFGIANNIFVQIGFVVLIGLACKNAVLIVEFAKQQHENGKSPRDAAVEASRLRLRPILMTSFAFILGVVPLAIATGAGMEMRRTLGIAVLAGMLGVTLCGLLLTPVFYAVLQGLGSWLSRGKAGARQGTPPKAD